MKDCNFSPKKFVFRETFLWTLLMDFWKLHFKTFLESLYFFSVRGPKKMENCNCFEKMISSEILHHDT